MELPSSLKNLKIKLCPANGIFKINHRRPFGNRDNEAMELAVKAQMDVKIPVGVDKLFEVDMAQREYYPGTF
jgi:hypothetical protein